MANKQCSINVLGDDLVRRLNQAGILDDIESKIDEAVQRYANDTLDADKLALIRNDIVRNEVNRMKKLYKERVVEAKNVTTAVEKMEDKIEWFETNFKKNPKVKRSIAGEKQDLIDSVLIGTLYESNFSKGTTLEKNVQSTFGRYWGNEVDRRLADEVGEDWYRTFTRKREDVEKIMDDLIAIQKDPARKTSVNNSNTPHYKIARAIADSFEKMMIENNMLGGKMNFFNLIPKVRLNVHKIRGKKEQFVNDYANIIDDTEVIQKFGISETEKIKIKKQELAEEEYNRIVGGLRDRDGFGNAVENDITVNRDFTVAKDGKSYFDLQSKYSADPDIASMFFSQFQRLSEQQAMTKMFGPNPLSFINKLKQQMRSSPVLKDAVDGEGMLILERGLKQKIENRPVARGYFQRFLSGIRNVTLGKLGFVFVDQLIMEPTFSFYRLLTRGDNTMKNILGNIGPLTGKKKRKSARFHAVAMEHYVGAINTRFFGNVYEQGGRVTELTRKFANGFMRYTGSTLLSDGQAAAGFAVQRMDITDALRSGRKWKNLKADPKKTKFILDLEQAGITETMWDNAMRGVKQGKFLDEEKLFDPFALPVINNTLRSRGQSDYDAWMAYFQKRVDGLSRMKPGEIENARLTFYSDRDVTSSFLKTLVQFKSFSFSISRRVYGDAFLHGGKLGVTKQALGMSLVMFPAAIIATQAREIGKGKAPISDIPTLFERSWARSGVTAFVAPFLDPIAESVFTGLYDQSKNKSSLQDDLERDLLGPSISALTDVVTGATSMAGAAVSPKEDFAKSAFGFTRDMGALLIPNGVPFSYLNNYLMYDVLEKNLLPKQYKKRQKKDKRRAKDQRMFKAKDVFQWADRLD